MVYGSPPIRISRPMTPGDVVEGEVTGVGRLSNRVQEIPAPAHHVGHQPTDTLAVRTSLAANASSKECVKPPAAARGRSILRQARSGRHRPCGARRAFGAPTEPLIGGLMASGLD